MVIMIDDDDDALEIYQLMIETTEYAAYFRTFINGFGAFQFLDNCVDTHIAFPKYILLDLNMPGLGGIDFIEKFEAQYKDYRQHTEILMLTSSVREKDSDTALSYDSVTYFINKPLSKDNLIALIQKSILG